MSLDHLKSEVREGWGDFPAADLCVRIIDYMSRSSPEQLLMLTFGDLTRASGEGDVTSDLLTAVSILRSVSILDARALFIDYDNQEYEIESSELADAHATGEFIHPHTGNPVPDFEEKVVPFFTPTNRFFTEANES